MPVLIRRLKNFLQTSPVVPFACFFIVVAVLYGRAVFFDITFFDDHLWVVDFRSYLVNGVHWWMFFKQPDLVTEVYYRPILNLSFALDARSGHGSPATYHLTNLIVHAINVCLVFSILKEWGVGVVRAFIGALIFLAHPALVQAVVWIPGRTDSILGLFCFSGFLAYLMSFRSARRMMWLAIYALCFFAALLTKETGIMLGLMVAGWDILRTKKVGWWKEGWPVLFITSMIVFVWACIRFKVLAHAPVVSLDMQITSFVKNLPAVIDYIGKTFLPVHLSVFPMLSEARLIYGFLALVLIGVWIGLKKDKRIKPVLWAWVWLIAFLLPSLVLSDLEYEYRLYVPMLGALLLIAELLPKNVNRRLEISVGLILVAILSCRSWVYADSFHDQWAFWTRAAAEAPRSPLAQKNLGSMYYFKGDHDKAEEYYRKALSIEPREQMVNNNLGLIYQGRGNSEEAVKFFQKEIQNYPNYELPYFNWGILLIRQGQISHATVLMEKAVALNPLLNEAYVYLIQLYLKQNRFEEARTTVRRLKSVGAEIPPHVSAMARQLNVDLSN